MPRLHMSRGTASIAAVFLLKQHSSVGGQSGRDPMDLLHSLALLRMIHVARPPVHLTVPPRSVRRTRVLFACVFGCRSAPAIPRPTLIYLKRFAAQFLRLARARSFIAKRRFRWDRGLSGDGLPHRRRLVGRSNNVGAFLLFSWKGLPSPTRHMPSTP